MVTKTFENNRLQDFKRLPVEHRASYKRPGSSRHSCGTLPCSALAAIHNIIQLDCYVWHRRYL